MAHLPRLRRRLKLVAELGGLGEDRWQLCPEFVYQRFGPGPERPVATAPGTDAADCDPVHKLLSRRKRPDEFLGFAGIKLELKLHHGLIHRSASATVKPASKHSCSALTPWKAQGRPVPENFSIDVAALIAARGAEADIVALQPPPCPRCDVVWLTPAAARRSASTLPPRPRMTRYGLSPYS
jgi:hypothetical protein